MKTKKIVLVIALVLLVVLLTGCLPKKSTQEGVGTEKSEETEEKIKEEGRKEIGCLTEKEFLNILPENWPGNFKAMDKGGCLTGDENCCEGIDFIVGDLEKEGKFVQFFVYRERTSAEARESLEFQIGISGGKDVWNKTSFKGSPAYETKDKIGLWLVQDQYLIQSIPQDVSREELEEIIGALKI